MKCKSCGGEISLTDERCPYCGRIITENEGHRAGLKAYKERSEKAKRGLSGVLSGNIPIVISAVVMVVLIIAVGAAVYVKDNAYHFRSDQMRKEAVKNYDEYSVEIQKYLDAGDYTGFAAFKEYHNIAEWEAPYDDLRLLWEMTYDYVRLVSNVESALMFGPEARWYDPEGDVSNCQSSIYRFYHEFDQRSDEIEADKYGDYIIDMKEKADIMLKVYFGLDDASRESFLSSSDIEQTAYLEEVIIHE